MTINTALLDPSEVQQKMDALRHQAFDPRLTRTCEAGGPLHKARLEALRNALEALEEVLECDPV